MRPDDARAVRLADYRPPNHRVLTVDLDVQLDPTATRVVADLLVEPHPEGFHGAALVFVGDGLTLTDLRLDGEAIPDNAYEATPERFTLHRPPTGRFRLTFETLVNPSANTQLMGLYRSSKTFCTQCEAEGFRRITYFPDRPDVLATYRTRLEADRTLAPTLLSNGNLIEAGEAPGGRHYTIWDDPHPKPSYLFALVGGDLEALEEDFVTRSGRRVKLAIHVEPGNLTKASYAMDALKRAMRWDEEAFGREYDLDIFNVVAVSDFNMGAMENKGLNIFNDKYVLASPQTATDADYSNIEAIIAHEYFHNWTGNRITCRDWFQLCLKEGLTVYRDQEFTAAMRSAPVKRVSDVRLLKSHQFPEDGGPLAHPVRPQLYHEINNFYTATVYEKGAEVIRVLKGLIGAEAFAVGMALYFDRHDGRAATVEDFVACFAETSGRDLSRFMLWYAQAGTPEVSVKASHDARLASLTLDIRQSTPPTPGQPVKEPMPIPLAIAALGADGAERPLLDEDGKPLPALLTLDHAEMRVTLSGHPTRPVLSLNRGFAAPVKIVSDAPDEDLAFLARRDRDPYNRWQAIQTLATRHLIAAARGGPGPRDPAATLAALGGALEEAMSDPAFAALTLTLPSEADIAREIGRDVDPDAIFAARDALRRAVGVAHGPRLKAVRLAAAPSGPYSPDAASAGRRALANIALDYLVAGDPAREAATAEAAYHAADNMTDRLAALTSLAHHAPDRREATLADFYDRFRADALVVDKWFSLQAAIPEAATLHRVEGLAKHEAFTLGNPNRARALYGSFATANATQFNRADGAGFRLMADVVLALDPINAQVAARLLGAFRSWRALEPVRRGEAEAALTGIAATKTLSADVRDIVERALG